MHKDECFRVVFGSGSLNFVIYSKNEYSEVSVESNVSRETSSGKVSLPDSECAGILFHVKQRVCI